jgi:predicted Fe-S protein YdhL (DUF1289 family)
MSKTFRVWLDSGANVHSCYRQIISLDELGIEDEEWDSMSEEEREDVMREIAWDRMDWGFQEIQEGEEE